MPFKSKDQIKACYAKADKNWNCDKWMKETPQKGHNLPKKKRPVSRRAK